MTAVLDPDVLTGFHDGPVYYSAEDGRFYLLTDDGAIPADGPRYATTLDAAQLSMCGADHFTLRSDGTVDMMRPASPYTAAYEDTIMGMHFPGGLGLMGASGSSSLRKRLALNFLSGGSLDPRITFTRASNRTRVNSSGLIETLANNVHAIDYDPVTLAAKGLLIEEQRTNLLLRSQEFNNASWIKTAVTVTANSAVAPDGTSTAAKIVEGVTTSPHICYQLVAKAASIVTRTMSFYAKAGERTKLQVNFSNQNGTAFATCYLDLAAGTVGAVSYVGSGVSAGSATVTPAGNGWYRCTITATFEAAITSTVFYPWIVQGTGTTTNYAGDGTSGFYLWGAQIEDGAFATSYIPTTSASVTRAADVASMTGANFSDWHNPTEGTFVVDLMPKGIPASGNARFLEAGIAGGAERCPLIYGTSTAGVAISYLGGGATQASLSHGGGVFAANTPVKMATAYKVNDFASVVNGGAVQSDLSGTVPAPDRLTIGWATSAPNEPFNGHIRRLTYYPARLSNSLMQSLTA